MFSVKPMVPVFAMFHPIARDGVICRISCVEETGRTRGEYAEAVTAETYAPYRNAYAVLAHMADVALQLSQPDVETNATHRWNYAIELPDPVNVGLSAEALAGANEYLPRILWLQPVSQVRAVDAAIILLRRAPDKLHIFPRGKWATIQALEQAALFQFSELNPDKR